MCLGLLAAVAAPVAASEPLLEGDVPFAFVAGDTTFAAGRYEIGVPDLTSNILEIRNLDTKKTLLVPYVTRLAARPGDKGVLVFDVQRDQKYLSEVFAPPTDGFSLEGARGKHTHTTVNVLTKK
jgi:hypothetical protein